MKRLHYSLIAASLLILLSGCGSSSETAADYVESGKTLVKEGKLQKARLEFKNALQIDPRTADAFYQLALLDEKSQDWKSMYANLSTTEQLNPTHHEASTKLGQLYLLSGNYEKAREKAKKVLDVAPDNVAALVLRASIELKQQNLGSALKDIEQALSYDEQNIEAMSVKAMVFNQQGDYQKAISLLEEAIAIEPDQLSLTMIKLSILEVQKDYPAVEKIYRQLRQDKPDERWVVVSLAKLLNMQDRYDDAKFELEQFIIAHPDDRDAKLMLVSLVKSRYPEQAIELLGQYSEAEPEDFDLLFAKIKLQLDRGDVDQALAGLQKVVDKDADGNNGRKAQMILANYDFRQGDIDSVEDKVRRVLSVAPEDEAALILKSKINLMKKDIDTAVTDLRVVLRNNPESVQALVLLGRGYLETGSTQLAEDNFRQALEIEPANVTAALFVAERLMASDNINRAHDVLNTALMSSPKERTLLQAFTQVKIVQQDWVEAMKTVELLRENDENSLMALYLDGRILQGQEKYDEAIEKYKAVLNENVSMVAALEQLANSYLKLEQKTGLMSYLTELTVQHPNYVPVYQLLSELYINDKDWAKAIETINQGLNNEPSWSNGYVLLAGIYQIQGDTGSAISAYKRGLDVLPESNALALPLASLYEGQAQYDEAKALYENMLARDPDIEVAINNLASLLTDKFKTDDSIQRAVELTVRFENSEQPYFVDTHAWALVQSGAFEKGQVLLEGVVRKAPQVAVFNYHLGVLYHKQAKSEQAEQYLKQAQKLAQQQDDQDLLKQVNEVLSSL